MRLSASELDSIRSFDGLNKLLQVRNNQLQIIKNPTKIPSTNGDWVLPGWKKFGKVIDYLNTVDLSSLSQLLNDPKPLELLAGKIREYNRDHPNRNRKAEIVLFRFLLSLPEPYPAEDIALWIDTGLPLEKLKTVISSLLPIVCQGIELRAFIKLIIPQLKDVTNFEKISSKCANGLKIVKLYVQLDTDRQNEIENCPPNDQSTIATVLFTEQQSLQGKPLAIRLNNDQLTLLKQRGSPLLEKIARYDGVHFFVKVENGRLTTTTQYNENDLIEVYHYLNKIKDYDELFKTDPFFESTDQDVLIKLFNSLAKINKPDEERRFEFELFNHLFDPYRASDKFVLCYIESEPFKIFGLDFPLFVTVSRLFETQRNSFESICRKGCQLFKDKVILASFLEIHAKYPDPNTPKDCEALLDQVQTEDEQKELLFYFHKNGKDEAFKHKQEILLDPSKRNLTIGARYRCNINADSLPAGDPMIPNFINIFVKRSAKRSQAKTMLIWRTTHDPNHSFTHGRMLKNIHNFSASYSITLLSARDSINIPNALFDYILIQGHGIKVNGTSGMVLYEEKGNLVTFSAKSSNLLTQLSHRAKPRGVITLECCAAGEGPNSLAEVISTYCPQSTVYASTQPTPTPYYSAEFRPTFVTNTNTIVTRAFQNGTIVLK